MSNARGLHCLGRGSTENPSLRRVQPSAGPFGTRCYETVELMKKANSSPQRSHQGRRRWGRAQQQPREDPYELVGKPPEPADCPQCGASIHEGRWQWASAPSGARHLCAACRRINNEQPAGILTLSGTSPVSHKAEILNLVRHQEESEKADHPLNRIIAIEERDDAVGVTTTDIDLPRRIGEALKRAFHGDLEFGYEEDGYFLRAHRGGMNQRSEAVGDMSVFLQVFI